MAARQHPGDSYAAFREILRAVVPYEWRRRGVQMARSGFGLRSLLDRLAARTRRADFLAGLPADVECPTDFYHSLTLLPHLPAVEAQAILDQPLPRAEVARPDIICFSIVDWSFRFQRPQQLMTQFAAHGHRVFYISLSKFRSAHAQPRFAVTPIQTFNDAAQGRLFEVSLSTQSPLDVAGNIIGEADCTNLQQSLEELRRAYNINEAVSYVMLPSWAKVALATQQWGWRVVYDCMDEWENFPQIKPPALALEKELVSGCDLLVVTAQRLYDKWLPYQRPTVLARNATDFEFYAQLCRPNPLLAESNIPVIGYFGAIADWFDIELLAGVAKLRPYYNFVLLGGVFDVDISQLQALPNVKLLGQQPYETMPQYLYHFAACVIPFKVNPITEATDPVKLYEYLSGGKPVVAVRLPELEPYRDEVYFARNAAEFAAKLDAALAEDSPQRIERRKQLAQQHTWPHRYRAIADGIKSITPKASIIIVTYNNLALTRLCLVSVFRNTEYPNFEVIVVDNRSTDGTPEYLRSLAGCYDNLKVILNDENDGFAKANNQGIEQSIGEYIVLLNNDAIVPAGWLSRLILHLRDPQVGLIGPVTNSIGNEAQITVPYHTWAEMAAFARQQTWRHHQSAADIDVLAMYCIAVRRTVFETVGPLDEQFGIGMFEDDDYSLRVRRAGLRVLCASDVFVHHFGQAAFGKLIKSGAYDAIFDENRRRYEKKWGITWQAHQHRALTFAPHTQATVGAPSMEMLANNDSHQASLDKLLRRLTPDSKPNELFANIDDDFWFWLYTEGYRRNPALKAILPGMPDEKIQLTYTGDKGDPVLKDAHSAYRLFKQLYEIYAGSLAECHNIMDFGCGWGRILRFFLKDVAPSTLWGVDPIEEMIHLCKQDNKWSNFEVINTKPPIQFQDNTFDLIYSFSVFSHLSEEMHQNWLVELHRILKPGGILIATTRGRDFIELSATPMKYENIDRALSLFPNTQQSLSDFDSGQYCFSQIVHEGEWSYWGETAIPRNYVLNNWTQWFTFLEYIDDRNRCSQNVIVMSKPADKSRHE